MLERLKQLIPSGVKRSILSAYNKLGGGKSNQ